MDKKAFTFSDKTRKTLLIAAVIFTGIIFILLSASPEKKDEETVATRLDDYIKETERRLCSTISGIDGAGKTKVFITTENTFETVYASNASVNENINGKTTEKNLAYSAGSSYSSSDPVVVKELCPDIKGVLIVCEGGNDSKTSNEIKNAVSIALGISQNKIYVTGGTD